MADAAANIVPSQSWVQRNLRVTSNDPTKCARVIELSSSDLEPIETSPASERRLAKPSLVRTGGAAIRALPGAPRVALNSPIKPVRVVELSSSDLEPIETIPASKCRLAKPPPLPKQSRPALAVIRRFGLRASIGVIALLCVVATVGTLTFTRITDQSVNAQSEPAAMVAHDTGRMPLTQKAPAPGAKTAAPNRQPINAQSKPATKVTRDTVLAPVTQKAHPVPAAKAAAANRQPINAQSKPATKVTRDTVLVPVTQKAHPVPVAKTASPRGQTNVRATPAAQKGRTPAAKSRSQATVSSHRWTPANL